MKQTFKTVLQACGQGAYLVMPAIGMGVWGGDPDVYWRAFFDAVLEDQTNLEKIFVNPGHQKTPSGVYAGSQGEEFETILNEYKNLHPNNKNLNKIVDLFKNKTDILLFAKNLKQVEPERIVALLNPSDPDVTIGRHVTQYSTDLCHGPTGEENISVVGDNALGSQDGAVLNQNNPPRVLQAK